MTFDLGDFSTHKSSHYVWVDNFKGILVSKVFTLMLISSAFLSNKQPEYSIARSNLYLKKKVKINFFFKLKQVEEICYAIARKWTELNFHKSSQWRQYFVSQPQNWWDGRY